MSCKWTKTRMGLMPACLAEVRHNKFAISAAPLKDNYASRLSRPNRLSCRLHKYPPNVSWLSSAIPWSPIPAVTGPPRLQI